MSRRVSQLSIINPAKTGQTGQMSQMFVSSKVQSGAVIQRPCLCMIATSFNCTVMERRKRLRRGAGYGRDWLTEVMKRGKETPSVSHRFSMNGCNCIPKRLGSYNWGQLQPQPPNDCSWRGSDPNYSKTDLYDLVGSAFFVPVNRQIRRINWHLTQLQWRMRQEVWWGNWIQVECGTCFNTSRVGGCQNWSLQEVGCICLMSIYVHFIHLGSIHSILLLKSVPSNPF